MYMRCHYTYTYCLSVLEESIFFSTKIRVKGIEVHKIELDFMFQMNSTVLLLTLEILHYCFLFKDPSFLFINFICHTCLLFTFILLNIKKKKMKNIGQVGKIGKVVVCTY